MTRHADTGALEVLRGRFEANPGRHGEVRWVTVAERFAKKPEAYKALQAMEDTGGEPDVVGFDSQTGEVLIFDCSPESPRGRRSLCYDREALEGRKENRPESSVIERAADMGIELLCEAQYRFLQSLDEFDLKTSSWVRTPLEIRRLGGALFCDRRYGKVFVYHNGAESYYAARGFRGLLRV